MNIEKEFSGKATLTIAATGAANLASVGAMCARLGVKTVITDNPELILKAKRVLLPGVGAFGAAMDKLKSKGLDIAMLERVKAKRPTMGICLGMQMLCQGSEETPKVPGIGVIPVQVEKFKTTLPLPQLGWNRVAPYAGRTIIREGWAYYANSYRLDVATQGFTCAQSVYGEAFIAALEKYSTPESDIPYLLLCQFHPELSGPWGLDLFRRWMASDLQGDAHE